MSAREVGLFPERGEQSAVDALSRDAKLLPLDAHGHFDPQRAPEELLTSGCVLAGTLSPEEWDVVSSRRDPFVAWGIGCHPRLPRAQAVFDSRRFRAFAEKAAVISEIGLNVGSRVPIDAQLGIFRDILEFVAETPRLVSIHSYAATGLVLDELERRPIRVPILHWWTGSAAETRRAVELGCLFSVHSQVARRSVHHTAIPKDRLLVESDHGVNDPPAAIPCRIEWVEHLVSQHLKCQRSDVRALAWANLRRIVDEVGVRDLLPDGICRVLEREE
jgi:TatD DNase family protein